MGFRRTGKMKIGESEIVHILERSRWECKRKNVLLAYTLHVSWITPPLESLEYLNYWVYYESMKRNLLKPIYECRCNGRLQTKRFTGLTHTGSVVELEHLKIKTRLTKREVCECEGWVWDLDAIGAPSIPINTFGGQSNFFSGLA